MSNMRKLINSRGGIENKEKCETVESGFEIDGWKVEFQKVPNSPKKIRSTLDELFNECEEQFRVLPDFGITNIERLDDMVIDTDCSVCFFHPLVKDKSGNWKVGPHAHYIDF